MPAPNTMSDLAPVAGDNYPVGSEPIGNNLDNYLRAHAALIRQGNAVASSSMPSGSTVNVANANGESVLITGSATINSLGTGFVGCKRELRFSGSPTLVHSSNLQLPANQNISASAGHVLTFRCIGNNTWVCTGGRVRGVQDVPGLQGALDSKANDDSVVKTSGNQSGLSGNKEWTGTHSFSKIGPIGTELNSFVRMDGETNSNKWLRFRRSGSGSENRAGVVFSSFSSDHWFLNNPGGSLQLSHSSEPSDTPSYGGSSLVLNISSGGTFTYLGGKVWHEGNDGSGSGMDADYLRGFYPDTSAAAGTIARRDEGADLHARLFHTNFSSFGGSSISAGASLAYRNNDTSDDAIRFASNPASIRGWLGLGSASQQSDDRYARAVHTHSADDIQSGTLHLNRIPSLPASQINSGTFPVARGGTGQSSLASGSFLVGNGSGGVQTRTPAQVLSDIGALPSSSPQANGPIGVRGHGATDRSLELRLSDGSAVGGIRRTGDTANNGATEVWASGRPIYFSPGGAGSSSGQVEITTGGVVVATNVTGTSDRRLKDDIKVSKPRLFDLGHYRYRWKKSGARGIGVMAQEVRDVAPEYVHEAEDGTLSVDKAGLALEMVLALADKLEAR